MSNKLRAATADGGSSAGGSDEKGWRLLLGAYFDFIRIRFLTMRLG